MLDDDTGGPTVETVAERRPVKAAKDHRCSDCGGEIPVGTRYWRGFLLIDGEPTVTKTHTPSVGACVPPYWEAW